MAAVREVRVSDLGGAITGVSTDGPATVVVETADGLQNFRVEVGDVRRGYVAATTLQAGTADRPHVVRISPRVATEQLTRVWVHEISHALHDRTAPATGWMHRMMARFSAEDRDACGDAQFNEYRLLRRQWTEAAVRADQTGQAHDREQEKAVRGEIEGLAAAIRERGQVPPAHPWEARLLVAAPGIRAGTFSPRAELTGRVENELSALDEAIAGLRARIDAKQDSISTATAAEAAAQEQATVEADAKDDGRHARIREAEADAKKQAATRVRHEQILEAYRAALARAKAARAGFQSLLDGLNTTDGQLPDALSATALEAADHLELYRVAMGKIAPPDVALPTGMSSGKLPHLTALADRINETLVAQGIDQQFGVEGLRGTLLAEFGNLVGAEGLVLRVGDRTPGELRVRLKAKELVEVLDPPVRSSQNVNGMLPQGGRRFSTTATTKTGRSGGFSLSKLTELAGEQTIVHWLGKVFSTRASVSVEQARAVTANASEYALGGGVEDNRGESVLFSGKASWDLEVRSNGRPWSAAGTVETGRPGDFEELPLSFSHAYTVAAPQKTVRLDDAAQRSENMPEHVVSALDGLDALSNKVRRKVAGRLGSLANHVSDQIHHALVDDLAGELRESTGHGLIRPLVVDGQPVGHLLIKTEVRYQQAEPVGAQSEDHWQERLRVGFSGNSGDQSNSTTTSVAAGAGAGAADVGGSGVGVGPSVQSSRSTARSGSLSAGGTAIQVGVQRYTGPTQAYRVVLDHTVTIALGNDVAEEVKASTEALLRFQVNDAYRYGLPVDATAVVKDADGRPVIENGRQVVQGDPRTDPSRKLELPSWTGIAAGQLRGPGPWAVQALTGGDEALPDVAKHLSKQGYLPPLDANGEPDLTKLSEDPVERLGQLLNLTEVRNQFSALRLETGYDIAVQTGLQLTLVRPRLGHATESITLRIDIEPDYSAHKAIGVTTDEAVVILNIGSNSTGRSGGRAKSLPWSAKLGLSGDAAGGLGGSTGFSYSRSSLGRALNWVTGGTVNQVTLVESKSPVAVFEIPHKLTVTQLDDGKKISVHKGTQGTGARVLMDSDFLPSDEPSATTSTPYRSVDGPVAAKVLDRAILLGLDTGNLLDSLPPSIRMDHTALRHLASFLNPRSLMSHPGWTSTPYRTQVVVRGGVVPGQARVSLVGEIRDVEHVGVTDGVAGHINLSLSSQGMTSATSTGSSWTGSAGGVGDQASGGGLAGRRSESRVTSTSVGQIWGAEQLTIEVGRHYVFKASVDFDLQVSDGTVTGNVTGATESVHAPGQTVFQVPERDALRFYSEGELALPVHMVADAVERFLNDKLSLDRKTLPALLRRYRADLAAAAPAPALSERHTPEVLTAKVAATVGPRPTPMMVTAAEKLNLVLERAVGLGKIPQLVALPEDYRTSLGGDPVESVTLSDDAELLDTVTAVVESAGVPVEQDPVLATSFFRELGGARWWGRIDDMLSPGGLVRSYPLTRPGGGSQQKISVRIKAKFVDGTAESLGETQEAGAISQSYLYEWLRRSQGIGRSIGGSGNLETGHGGSSTLGTDRSGGVTAEVGHQSTRLERIASFAKRERIRRVLQLTIEVTLEQPDTHGLVRRAVGWAGGSLNEQEVFRAELLGEVVQLIPAALVDHGHNAEAETTPAQLVDHRRPTLPSSYVVKSTTPFGRGNPVSDELLDAVSKVLARADLLNPIGVRMYRAELANQFSASARNATFSRMATGQGYAMTPLPVPGHANQVVEVTVEANVSDVQPVTGPLGDTELGEVNRSEWTTSTAVSLGRLLPLSGGLSTSGDESSQLNELGVSGGLSAGEQVSDRVGDLNGVRRERSRFEKGTVVTARVRVSYDLTVERKSLKRGGGESSRRVVRVPGAATGEASLTMFQHEYDAMIARMERGETVTTPWTADNAAPPAKQYLTVRPWVIADPAAPSKVLTDALTRAREQQVEILLTVTDPDGRMRHYQALPDGSLHGDPEDGGFAEAFATLHPRLAELADEAGVNLRSLYNSTGSTLPFTTAVAAAVEAEGLSATVHPQPLFPLSRGDLPGEAITPASDRGSAGTTLGAIGSGGNAAKLGGFVADDPVQDHAVLAQQVKRALADSELRPYAGVVALSPIGDGMVVEVTTNTAKTIVVRFTVGPVADGHPAAYRLTGGTEDAVVTVSDRIKAEDLRRAIVHEIRELSRLTPEGDFTPHEQGRMGEMLYLDQELELQEHYEGHDPARRRLYQAKMRELVEELRLAEDAGRRQQLEPMVRDVVERHVTEQAATGQLSPYGGPVRLEQEQVELHIMPRHSAGSPAMGTKFHPDFDFDQLGLLAQDVVDRAPIPIDQDAETGFSAHEYDFGPGVVIGESGTGRVRVWVDPTGSVRTVHPVDRSR